MKLWTEKAERGSAWLIRLIVWLARTCGRPLCRALLYPIVLYFVLTDPHGTARVRRIPPGGDGPTARMGRRLCSHPQLCEHLARPRLYGRRRVRPVPGDHRRPATRGSRAQGGRGCVLLGSHLGSFDLMMLAQRAMDGRPVSIMMRVDPRSRLRSIAGIEDRGPNFIPLGRPESFLRAHEALAQRGHRRAAGRPRRRARPVCR